MRGSWACVSVVAVIGAAGVGCGGKGPTAREVCAQLEERGIAKECKETMPAPISARARERLDFELVAVPGRNAAVMDFASDEDFVATVKAYEAVGELAGPHRYGNAKVRIFVQANAGLPAEEGLKLKGIIDSL